MVMCMQTFHFLTNRMELYMPNKFTTLIPWTCVPLSVCRLAIQASLLHMQSSGQVVFLQGRLACVTRS